MKADNLDKKIDQALAKPTSFQLNAGFSRRVMQRMELRSLIREQRVNRFVWVITLVFGVVCMLLMVLFTNGMFINLLQSQGGWIAVLSVMLILFQYLDQRFVKRHQPD